MRGQHRALAHVEKRAVGIVTDSSADLDDAILDRHHISIVPLQVVFGDRTFQDRQSPLVAAYRPRDCFTSMATGVIGTHVGEGAWGVFYQVEAD